MWFFESGDCGEAQIIQRINGVSSPSQTKTSLSGDALLNSFLHDLSFWDFPKGKANNSKRGFQALRRQSSCSYSSSSGSSCDNKAMQAKERSGRHSNSGESNASVPKPPIWKTAIDPVTGRTYYYDAITRKTQWNKVRA